MRRRSFEVAHGVAATLVLLSVPVVLVLSIGWPLSEGLLSAPWRSTSWVLHFVGLIAWVAWLVCFSTTVRRVVWLVSTGCGAVENHQRKLDWLATRIATSLLALNLGSASLGSAASVAPIEMHVGAVLRQPVRRITHSVIARPVVPPAATERTGHARTRVTIDGSPTRGTNHRHHRVRSTTERTHEALVSRSRTHSGVAVIDASDLISDLATLGLCCLGVAAVGRRLWMRERGAKFADQSPPEPDPADLQDALSVLEGLLAAGGLAPPAIRLVGAGADGFVFTLGSRVDWAPSGLRLGGDGTSWMAGTDFLTHPAIVTPPEGVTHRLAVPLGSDRTHRWAIVLESGSSIAVIGPNAETLLSSIIRPLYRPPWSETVRVSSGPGCMLINWSGLDSPREDARITRNQDESVDLTIVIDDHTVTIHPEGMSLSPLDHLAKEPAAPRLVDVTVKPIRSVLSPAPGIVDSHGYLQVRLLSSVPSIEGLTNPLPPKRARRVIELVAYLALHHPNPVSGERLRNRVLGSPDSDAAAKTLFNTVGAARHALGLDPTGTPYLPNASRHGHYSLSDLVVVDAVQAMRLFRHTGSAESSEVAIALFRTGFDLVTCEPLAGVLSGYNWWRSEGYEARFSSATVDAACKAIRLAVENQLFELGTWILDRARLVDPYSELLSRAAMTAAAAAGDQTRLRREWDECVRRVRELDPDAIPSVESQRLLERLMSRSPSPGQASLAAIEEAP